MRAPLSVVIPTLDSAAELPHALAALVEGVGAGLIREVVVSDGGSRDATLEIARAAGAEVVEGPAGRGGRLRQGVAASAGPWLLALHPETRLGAGWSEAARAHIEEAPGEAGWFRLRLRAEGLAPRLAERWANLRAWAGLPQGNQGLLLPRALHEAVGGYQDLPTGEDVALARRLRGRLRGLPATAHVPPARPRGRVPAAAGASRAYGRR